MQNLPLSRSILLYDVLATILSVFLFPVKPENKNEVTKEYWVIEAETSTDHDYFLCKFGHPIIPGLNT